MSAKDGSGSDDGGRHASHTRIAVAALQGTCELSYAASTSCTGCETLALIRARSSFQEVLAAIEERVARGTTAHGTPAEDAAQVAH